MTERWLVPKFNAVLSPAEREAVAAHAANAIAADLKGLDRDGRVEVLITAAAMSIVKMTWAEDRVALLEQRLAEIEGKTTAGKAKVRT